MIQKHNTLIPLSARKLPLIFTNNITRAEFFCKKIGEKPKKKSIFLPFSYHHTETLPFSILKPWETYSISIYLGNFILVH